MCHLLSPSSSVAPFPCLFPLDSGPTPCHRCDVLLQTDSFAFHSPRKTQFKLPSSNLVYLHCKHVSSDHRLRFSHSLLYFVSQQPYEVAVVVHENLVSGGTRSRGTEVSCFTGFSARRPGCLVDGCGSWLVCPNSKRKKENSVGARWGAVTMTEEKTMTGKKKYLKEKKGETLFFLLILFSSLLTLRFKLTLTFTFRVSWRNTFSAEKQAVALWDRLPLWGCQISRQLSALSSLNLSQSQKNIQITGCFIHWPLAKLILIRQINSSEFKWNPPVAVRQLVKSFSLWKESWKGK